MELFISAVNILTIIAIFIVGIATYSRRNTQSALFFSFLLFAVSVWLLLQYIAQISNSPSAALWLVRLSLVASNWLALVFFMFMRSYTKKERLKVQTKTILTLLCLASFFSVLDLTNLSIQKVTASISGIAIESVGVAYVFKILFLIVCFVWGIILLVRNTSQLPRNLRSRNYILLGALAQALVIGILASTVFATSLAIQIATPISILLMAIMISYAIIKHKLFDIRLVVARSLAYILSLGSIAGLYVFLIFGIFAKLGGINTSRTFQQVFYLFTVVLLGFSFPTIKHFFDKVTNRLFYRDAYDTQRLLNEFNETIVSTIEIDKLLNRAAKTIEKYLNPEFCSFAINGQDKKLRIISRSQHLSPNSLDAISIYISSAKEKILIPDLIGGEKNDVTIILNELKVGAIARIAKSNTQESTGYILLGYKKSGNIYNSQDIGALEILANELAIAIENALQYEEIQNFAKTLQDKVDDATRQLRHTNEKLKQLDQTKDDFISMASHQLRTPLTSVKGYVSMVMEGDAGKINASQKKLLDQAFVSSQRMVYLIADLLNVSRLRTGKFIIEPKPTNLADVVEGEISQLIETAKGRGLELTYKKPKDFPDLMLDDTKIRQVIMNFADNAIYYTPAGGHIQVGLEDKGDSIEFTVTDDGIGVPKSEQHHLFNKFYRAGNAKKARPDGTGLGLFMAKKVIIAQGGAIIFKTQEGKGSTFGFSFAKAPLSPSHYKAPKTAEPAKTAVK